MLTVLIACVFVALPTWCRRFLFPGRHDAFQHFRSLGVELSVDKERAYPICGFQFSRCPVSDCDLRFLRPFQSELTVIGLEHTQITDEGLTLLTEFPRLDNIDVEYTTVTDKGLRQLAKLENLEFLHIRGTQVTRAGVDYIQRALPKCEIVWDDESDA